MSCLRARRSRWPRSFRSSSRCIRTSPSLISPGPTRCLRDCPARGASSPPAPAATSRPTVGWSSRRCGGSRRSNAARSCACRAVSARSRPWRIPKLLAQIRRLAGTARYVTSVCTGALVLGAAGLLKGKRATSHWAWRDALPAFGAIADSGSGRARWQRHHRRRRHRRYRLCADRAGRGRGSGDFARRCSSASSTHPPRRSMPGGPNSRRPGPGHCASSGMRRCAVPAMPPSSGLPRACHPEFTHGIMSAQDCSRHRILNCMSISNPKRAPSDFDFIIGDWHVQHRRLDSRLSGCTDWTEFPGLSSTRKILGGYGNVEDNVLHFPDGEVRAAAFRSYDDASQEWAIWWLDGRYPAPPRRAGRWKIRRTRRHLPCH